MGAGKAARSLRKGEEPWQTFTVRVVSVRGRREIRAAVYLSHVTGVVGATGVRPRVVWEGEVGSREPGHTFTPEDAARFAQLAIGEAFPTLF